MPLKAQNDYIFQKFGGHGPLAAPMAVGKVFYST